MFWRINTKDLQSQVIYILNLDFNCSSLEHFFNNLISFLTCKDHLLNAYLLFLQTKTFVGVGVSVNTNIDKFGWDLVGA